MINVQARIGNFTSSEIGDLMTTAKDGVTFGKPAFTYIAQKNMERKLGRSLKTAKDVRAMIWGKFLEPRLFDLLGLEYSYSSQDTIVHPNFSYWVGTPDGVKHGDEKTVMDEKCPLTHESFCKLVDPIYEGLTGMDAMNAIRKNHLEGDGYYWQLVSNAILTKSKFAELIVYMPYQSELEEIRQQANQSGDPKHYWIWSATDDELPYLVNGGYYKNINIIRFEVPLQDKLLLAKKVQEAGSRLIDPANPVKKEQPVQPILPLQDAISLLKKIG